MAFPLMAGLPWLASILGGLFVSIFTFLAQYLTKRLALVLAVVIAISGLTVAFFAAIVGILSGLAQVTPPQLNLALGLVYPTNANLLIASIISARLSRWVYEWNVKVIQLRLF
jgi:hypothetical protein